MGSESHACARCSQPIRGRSQYLPCASSNMRFHCKCINVQAEEYNFFMESGTSKYKCNQCMKRRDPSTAGLISEACIAVTPTEGSAACLDSADAVYGDSSESVIQLFQSMASQLEVLTREVRELRVENSSLRDEVRDLRDCVCGKVEFPALPKGSDRPAPSTGSFASVVMTDPRASHAGVPPPKFHARQKSPVRHQRTVVHRSSDPERQTQRPPTTVRTAKQTVLETVGRDRSLCLPSGSEHRSIGCARTSGRARCGQDRHVHQTENQVSDVQLFPCLFGQGLV